MESAFYPTLFLKDYGNSWGVLSNKKVPTARKKPPKEIFDEGTNNKDKKKTQSDYEQQKTTEPEKKQSLSSTHLTLLDRLQELTSLKLTSNVFNDVRSVVFDI